MGQLQPRVTIPMHYGINGLAIPLDGLAKFLHGKSNVCTHASLELTADSLPVEPQIVVLTLAVALGT
jgi:L-ascorbate metabolism protein UlaG (beta-lactamase superfamily)